MPIPERDEPVTPSIDGHIDSPAEESVFSAWIHLAGWTFSTGGESVTVRAHVAGNTVAEIPARQARPDVAAVFPSIPGAATSGFDTWLPKRSLPDESQFILSLEVSTSQARQTLGTRRLTWIPQPYLRHARDDY